MLIGKKVSPTLTEKYTVTAPTGHGYDAQQLHIPFGTYNAEILKNEPVSAQLKEYRVIIGTYEIKESDDFAKMNRILESQSLGFCDGGKFQMLLSRDPFPDSKWQGKFGILDVALEKPGVAYSER